MNETAQQVLGDCDKQCPQMILAHREISHIKERLERGDKSLDVLPQLLSEVRSLAGEVKTLSEGVGQTKDIVVAWGSIQGFGKTMKAVSGLLKTTAIITTALGTIYFIFNHPDKALEQVIAALRTKD